MANGFSSGSKLTPRLGGAWSKGYSLKKKHVVVIGVLLAVVLLAVAFQQRLNPRSPGREGVPATSTVELKESYTNPFERESQYVNPFSKFKSPFQSLQQ